MCKEISKKLKYSVWDVKQWYNVIYSSTMLSLAARCGLQHDLCLFVCLSNKQTNKQGKEGLRSGALVEVVADGSSTAVVVIAVAIMVIRVISGTTMMIIMLTVVITQ